MLDPWVAWGLIYVQQRRREKRGCIYIYCMLEDEVQGDDAGCWPCDATDGEVMYEYAGRR
jgi:hypothetical protein